MARLDALADDVGKKIFLTGNEAIARGFLEAGVAVVASYPGTPSTEITETLVLMSNEYDFYAEWSTNEKVAAEVAIAASISGLRAVTTMKGVGVNVASEPFYAFSYMGARGGLVMVDADDPGCHSSHTEQDNRFFARECYLPILEVCDQREAKDMARAALELSEAWCQPVLLRTTTRIGHSGSDVTLGKIKKPKKKGDFSRQPNRWVNLPVNARRMRLETIERLSRIQEAVNELPFNSVSGPDNAEWGIIVSGAAYGPVLETLALINSNKCVMDRIKIFKLATPFPLPDRRLLEFTESVENLLVVEELEPFVELQLCKLLNEHGINKKVHGKDLIPFTGELDIIRLNTALVSALDVPDPYKDCTQVKIQLETMAELPVRAPILCAGCGHRAAFYAMNLAERKMLKGKQGGEEGFVRPSDIGCYTLGFQPPLSAVDTHLCMGASIGVSTGFAHFIDNKLVATIGDSTFFHAGMPALLNSVFNKADITLIVLDNSTTAMTGHQPHPGVGKTACGEPTCAVDIGAIAGALGVESVQTADTSNLTELTEAIIKAVKFEGPAVVIAKGPCIVKHVREITRSGGKITRYTIDEDACTECGRCLRLYGCPAIYRIHTDNPKKWKVQINEQLCNGCGICAHEAVCKFNAIKPIQ